jgi:alpha/beta superfamily hydrolase
MAGPAAGAVCELHFELIRFGFYMYPQGNLFIPVSHGRLEAIIREPRGERQGVGLVCHPHPMGGGTMHNKVVFRAAAGLLDAGLVTLRFNFRGVGSSTGVHSEIEGGKEDVRDALEYIAEHYPNDPITLAGFSFGARAGIDVGMSDDRVTRLISIGTPIDKYDDFDFLKHVGKPILFVHGELDEYGSVENLKRIFDEIRAEKELVVIKNAGHFFDDHLNELREAIRNWSTRK